MKAIRNYTSTFLEYKVVKARLDYLLNKRDELETRYCGVSALGYENNGEQSQPSQRDRMMLFIKAITTPDEQTGLSLDDEIAICNKELTELQETLSLMAKAISRMTDVEAQLYCKIVLDGLKVSQAIKAIADAQFMSERNVYDRYYSQIKEDIEKIKR